MKTAQDIILKPIVTEESMMGIMVKKYTFKVAKTANKIEIAKAVEEAFPGYEMHMDPLSLVVSCHIGPGALAIACSRKVHI